jgi:hypothetical protein
VAAPNPPLIYKLILFGIKLTKKKKKRLQAPVAMNLNLIFFLDSHAYAKHFPKHIHGLHNFLFLPLYSIIYIYILKK